MHAPEGTLLSVLAVLLRRTQAPPLVYIVGTFGTLIGADLLNLDELRNSGAAMVSIGGAGTFDAVFLGGLLAALLASLAAYVERD